MVTSDDGPVTTSAGYQVLPTHPHTVLASADTIVIPGITDRYATGDGALPDDLAGLLGTAREGVRWVSICTGAFVLGAAGLLDGLEATTHWAHAEHFRRLFPQVRLNPDVLYVDNGDILTSAGNAAGIDLLLHILRRDLGSQVANRVARSAVVAPRRAGGQARPGSARQPRCASTSPRQSVCLHWPTGARIVPRVPDRSVTADSSLLAAGAVRRVDFGYFVRPPEETGTGAPRVEPCLGYLVRPAGASGTVVLFDTGMGSHPDVDAHYRPRRRSLHDALAPHGVRPDEVTHVTNCHLHFDHCGGNPALSTQPTFVQSAELAAARTTPDYTLPQLLDGSHFVEVDGETEIGPGLLLVPTPGHTDGHQSLVVLLPEGTVVVAGQSHDTATAYAADALSARAHHEGHPPPLPIAPMWLERLQALDPRAVVFAHDHSIWVP